MESSHYQGFYNLDKHVYKKPLIIKHNSLELDKVKSLYFKLKAEANIEPTIVLEYTGVYHLALIKFFKDNNLNFRLIQPLKASKHRQCKDNTTKNDSRDCYNLAEMFYENNLGSYYKRTGIYKDLKIYDQEYQRNKESIQRLEVTLNELLAVVYPFYKQHWHDILADSSLSFLEKYPHPSLVLNEKEDIFVEWYSKEYHHTVEYSSEKFSNIHAYANSITSGCNVTSPYVKRLQNTIRQLKLILELQEETINIMIDLASQDQNFNYIKSIPGIGEASAARIIAEFGDISRFKSSAAMVKYVGINPIIYQSGKLDGKHLSISKQGSKNLRSVLFTAVRGMIKKNSKAYSIKEYYYRKKVQPRVHPKVALIAAENKLIRTIYYLCKNKTYYDCSAL